MTTTIDRKMRFYKNSACDRLRHMGFLGVFIILKLSFGVPTMGFLDFLWGSIGDGWRGIETKVLLRLHESCTIPTFLTNSETWVLTHF